MGKKKRYIWSNLFWGGIMEFVIYMMMVLLTTLLAVRGTLPMEHCRLLLAIGAMLASLLTGIVWGRQTPLRGWGCLLCSGILAFMLILGNLSIEEGVSIKGIPIIACTLLGGIISIVMTGKKKHGGRKRKKVNL